MDWLKLSVRYVDDPRLGRLPEKIQARFFKLYLLAGQSCADGLITMSMEDIAWKLHISPDELKQTISILEGASFFSNNGKGPMITVYGSEQISQAEMDRQRELNRKRQENYRKEHKQNDNALLTHLAQQNNAIESESESEVEIESEKEGEISVESSQSRTDVTDKLIIKSKTELLKILGIGKKFIALEQDPKITKSDLMAEYARNVSREDVRKPAICTAMNLARHEYPEAEWYSLKKWAAHIPKEILKALDLEHLEGRSYAISLAHFQGSDADQEV